MFKTEGNKYTKPHYPYLIPSAVPKASLGHACVLPIKVNQLQIESWKGR